MFNDIQYNFDEKITNANKSGQFQNFTENYFTDLITNSDKYKGINPNQKKEDLELYHQQVHVFYYYYSWITDLVCYINENYTDFGVQGFSPKRCYVIFTSVESTFENKTENNQTLFSRSATSFSELVIKTLKLTETFVNEELFTKFKHSIIFIDTCLWNDEENLIYQLCTIQLIKQLEEWSESQMVVFDLRAPTFLNRSSYLSIKNNCYPQIDRASVQQTGKTLINIKQKIDSLKTNIAKHPLNQQNSTLFESLDSQLEQLMNSPNVIGQDLQDEFNEKLQTLEILEISNLLIEGDRYFHVGNPNEGYSQMDKKFIRKIVKQYFPIELFSTETHSGMKLNIILY